jgi:hypothetical protein
MIQQTYDRKINLVFRSVALPAVPEFTALQNAQDVYAKYAIKLEFVSGLSMRMTSHDLLQLDASDGTCQWNQASDEQKVLNSMGGRQGAGPRDVVVYYVNQIVQKDGSKLNGCAGHLPGAPTVVVSATGSPWTLGHELGHVLLGPRFVPVHATDSTNLMFSPTNSITASPPSLTPAQVAAIRLSTFCQPI